MSDILFNSSGEFQWVSITALISLLGILATVGSTIYIHKKTIKANVKSVTKIEWLNKIIDLSADYIKEYQLVDINERHLFSTKLLKANNTFKIEKEIITYDPIEAQRYKQNEDKKRGYNKSIVEYSEILNDSFLNSRYISNLLLLYFMDGTRTVEIKRIMNKINDISIKIAEISNKDLDNEREEEYYLEQADILMKNLNALNDAIEEFRENITKYINCEWKEIEKGK